MTTKTFQEKLERHAELAIKIGANVQPGQELIIEANIESAEFVRLVVRKAYEAGAKYVQVLWVDETVTRARFDYGSDASFDYFPQWLAEMYERFAAGGAAFILVRVPDPELYRGIDPSKVTSAAKAASKARQGFQHHLRNCMFSWCIIKAPTKAWASKVFPELPEDQLIDTMWETIFQITRATGADPVADWEKHIDLLKMVSGKLTSKKYKKLHYRAPGTDLTVELPKGHLWLGGAEHTPEGVRFVPNMPTEEVFTMPKRNGVNGMLASTMPLNLNGAVVDKFAFRFENGRIVDYTAEVGLEHLKGLLDTDEGARYLGEMALVPHNSPISNLNRIFYNIGIDENASCHFAIGNAYPINIVNGTKMSQDELLRHGANVSLTHVDFMIGSAELEIDGELADGTWEPVFRRGNWAISF